MQRKTKKILDIIKIIINLILLTFMLLSLITKNNNYYEWYWIMVSAMMGFEFLYLVKWNKVDEWNVDKKDSNAIRYSFDGLTNVTIMLSVFLYLGVFGFEIVNKSIKTNPYIIILVYILFTFSIVCNYLAIYSANRDTKKLAEKIYKYKK